MKSIQLPWAWTDPLVQPKRSQRDTRFDTWNARNLYRRGSLMTVARVLERYKLDFVGIQEVS